MIRGVAIMYENKMYSLPTPARHGDVIKLIVKEAGVRRVYGEQGFVTDEGVFLDRMSATDYALKSGQVEGPIRSSGLCSENLW